MKLSPIQKYNYKDYLNLSDDKRYEIIEGNLLMVPAPNDEHQNISRNIELLICDYVYKHELGEVFDAPFDVILDDNNIVQPDLLFIAKEQFSKIKGSFFGSPDLIIEIISPSSKSRDTYQKKELYELYKVKEYWIIDPGNKTAEIFVLNENGKYFLYSEGYIGGGNDVPSGKILSSNILKELEINLESIFKKR